jgi:hypothetical protein
MRERNYFKAGPWLSRRPVRRWKKVLGNIILRISVITNVIPMGIISNANGNIYIKFVEFFAQRCE